MTPFKTGLGKGANWAESARDCLDALVPLPDGANLGILYVCDTLASDMTEILGYLRQRSGIADWVGCVAAGVSLDSGHYFDQPAVVAMVGHFPAGSYQIFPCISQDVAELPSGVRNWMGAKRAAFGVIHADPMNPRTPDLVSDLGELTSAFLVGGLTSSREAKHQVAGRLTGGGVSGALFSEDVAVATTLSQGCQPVGPVHVVSDCLDNVIVGLDGRAALDVFREDIGELLARDLSRVGGYIHVAVPIEGSDTYDYMVRALTGVDPGRGWLSVGQEMSPGDHIMFVRRDPQTARKDLVRRIEGLKARLPHKPRGALYVSCVARGPNMFGEEPSEAAIVRDALGDDIPLVGFYAGGEISNSRLYGFTGVLSVFL